MKTPRILLGLLLLPLCLSACSKPYVNLSIASQPNVNPDHSGRPSPVILKMYELRSDLAFKQLDFQTLFEKPVQALGADLIAADEIVLVPGEARKVTYMPSPNTRYIGLLGGFRQMERAHWREVRAVDSESGNVIGIELSDASILIIPDNKKGSWNPEEAVRNFQRQVPRQNSQALNQYQVQYPAQYPAAAPDVNSTTVYGASGSGAIQSAPAVPAGQAYSPSVNQTADGVVRQTIEQAAGQVTERISGQAPYVFNSIPANTPVPGASSSGGSQGYVLPTAKRIGL